MKTKPTELEVEFSKLLSEAIDALFDAGHEPMAKHILADMEKAIAKRKKQNKTKPVSDDTYDEYGVNTKNSFNTPSKK